MHGRDKESFRGWTVEWWVVCARKGLSVESGEDVRSRGEALHAKELTFILKSSEKPWWGFKKCVNLEDHFDYHVESSSCGVNRKRQRDSWKAAGANLATDLIWEWAELWVSDDAFTEIVIAERDVNRGQERNTECNFERSKFRMLVKNSSGHNQNALLYLHGIWCTEIKYGLEMEIKLIFFLLDTKPKILKLAKNYIESHIM